MYQQNASQTHPEKTPRRGLLLRGPRLKSKTGYREHKTKLACRLALLCKSKYQITTVIGLKGKKKKNAMVWAFNSKPPLSWLREQRHIVLFMPAVPPQWQSDLLQPSILFFEDTLLHSDLHSCGCRGRRGGAAQRDRFSWKGPDGLTGHSRKDTRWP